MVCDFPEEPLDNISEIPLECEVEFAIDLVLRTSMVSMARYRMYVSELSELKKKLEDLLEKNFVVVCVGVASYEEKW